MWSQALAVGVPDELFWRITPRETGVLIEAMNRRQGLLEQAANLRAGLIAAEIRNRSRTKTSDRVWRATDFVRTEPQRMTVEQTEAALDMFAERVNLKHGSK